MYKSRKVSVNEEDWIRDPHKSLSLNYKGSRRIRFTVSVAMLSLQSFDFKQSGAIIVSCLLLVFRKIPELLSPSVSLSSTISSGEQNSSS